MGLGDVTNGIGAKFKNWARYVLTEKWLTVIDFTNLKNIYFQVYFWIYFQVSKERNYEPRLV